ncbi:16 kDa beta-galactoside-binding lectin-like [Corvus kubaryi]|uniref:16 kDa beta-galactoside-binding lectin-like n=1 Tax=Corvus kubaryi TaxID=68294 RepID=UPI001C055F22|nr:16 kDa beta-galactoside-binding lectin-like [Corvus kubaryi]
MVLPERVRLLELSAASRRAVQKGLGGVLPAGAGVCSMEKGVVVTQLDVEPGEYIKVKGKIQSDAKGFAVNVGKNSNTLMLHFNPRFDCHGDVNTLVCNSKEDGMWGEEDRKADFPFQHGDKIEMCISFDETEATVKLSEAEFKFPNRLGMDKIEYLAVEGDFKVKAIKFS